MPARKVPKSYLHVTGLVASRKNDAMRHFESPLERDFMLLLEFDNSIESYEEQPITIHYVDGYGKARTYTPDMFVTLREDIDSIKDKRPWLCEVKPREKLREHWHEFEGRYRAAYRHCLQEGWRFKIVTDREIRTPLLDNAKFLLPFLRRKTSDEVQLKLITSVSKLGMTTPKALLDAIEVDEWKRAEMLPQLWQLIAQRLIKTDLAQPLTMSSQIWCG